MKISYNWLRQYINTSKSPQELAKMLTSAGLEVEHIETFETIKGGLKGLVIGKVLTKEKHPNADKLNLTTVDIGAENPLKIVCGASNVEAGQIVAVATIGAELYPATGEPFTIKKSKIRGEESEGMICAEDEIGLGTSHEGIMVLENKLPLGSPLADYFGIETDYTIEIGLTPNRADAASHWGVARDLRVLLNTQITPPNIDKFVVNNAQKSPISVKVLAEDKCLRYAGVHIASVKVQESPSWLQNRLKSIGLKPINNIVDITNFVLHELGQPLHAFDAKKIQKNEIIVQTLSENTEFVTLDHQNRKLSPQDLMICDGNNTPLCLAGVFGGLDSGVNTETTDIFLESACFLPASVRKTSQVHNLKTDASFRFERGTDVDMVVFALKRASLLIKEVAGGEISEITDIYPNKTQKIPIKMRYAQINRIIGQKIEKETIQNILQNLDIQLSEHTEDGFLAQVPNYRIDVNAEIDIIEDIARLFGMDNIALPATMSADFISDFPEKDAFQTQISISKHLAGLGFSEMLNNSLTTPDYWTNLASFPQENNVIILNKLSEELEAMRPTLLFSGLEVIAYNLNRKQSDLKLFEFGKIYKKNPEKLQDSQSKNPVLAQYSEKNRISVFIQGNQTAETWQHKAKPTQYHDLAQVIMGILQKSGAEQLKNTPLQNDVFSYGATFLVQKREVAQVGKVQKSILKKMDIKTDVWYAEIDADFIFNKKNSGLYYEEISKFPEVRRDLSLVLDKNVSFQQILDLAWQKEKKLLKNVNVFDVYEGANLGEGKKSYSVSFILEDKEATLTDQIIDKVMQKLIQGYENDLKAIIRK
jgi:phenylalanyl-tRNA synthetase beta chain